MNSMSGTRARFNKSGIDVENIMKLKHPVWVYTIFSESGVDHHTMCDEMLKNSSSWRQQQYFTTQLRVVRHHTLTDFESFDIRTECCNYTDSFMAKHKKKQ